MKSIQIQLQGHIFSAELYDTPTAHTLYKSLPLKGQSNIWGEEIYFPIPLQIDLEPDAQEIVEPGELGYWPAGNAFCIFFGPTPVSTGPKPQAYSPVNVFGRIKGDLSMLKTIKSGEKVEVSI